VLEDDGARSSSGFQPRENAPRVPDAVTAEQLDPEARAS